ncbi:unnamed protein product [Vitrella brassicaformis CCMP3155]|uniref:Uncharacterized protein n=1 Tax=Vitrella brassicaformis (strain CCMP3155) TaxID=1169540 RepID=A0A0G4GQ58_VITBC|nr:unnamed protein product [Vitrella brassicaformis CCMP3155]|eukprot:CEM32505.1 unnamed protein product [Vitrella brassicaformis CCMP3155]
MDDGFSPRPNWRPNFHDCAIGELPASAHLSNFDLSLFETSAWRKSEVTPRDLGMKAGTTWESLVGTAKDHVLHNPNFYWKNITPPPLKAKQGGGGSRRLAYVDFPSSTLFRVLGDWNYTETKANEYLIRSVKVDDDNKILAVTLDTCGDIDAVQPGTVPWLPMPLPLFLTADDFAKLSSAHAAIEADIQESLDLSNVTNATQTARRALQAKEDTTSADEADLPGGKGGKSGRELSGTPPSGSTTVVGLPPRILVVYHNATPAEAGRRRLSGLTDIADKLGDGYRLESSSALFLFTRWR